MKHLLLLLLFSLLSLYGHNGALSQAPTYGERGSDLGIQVFQHVVRSKPLENVVLSPHGVASILGMLLPGAHGETRKQILIALRYKKNGPYRMLKKLHKALSAKSNQDAVLIANAMFTKEGFPMEGPFVATNKDNFQCESRSMDFSNADRAAEEINTWVNNKTKGHIPSLIKADMLDSVLTRLVAVNSIYFKGLWKSRFQPENTKMRSFTGGDGNVYKVPMMSQLSVFNIGVATTPQGLKYKVIELPYHGGSISMLIVLPLEEDTPLSRVIPHISTATVHSWTSLMHPRKVRLLIPKFTADAEVDLEAPLSALGITDMFSQAKADFRHISSEPLHVSKALQKAKIEVNEDGTKATAVTTAILLARSSPPWVTVDRPFLFLIRHKPTGTILFMGQINQP
ncbi:glia-derived nexin [Labrus bergylta]|uniref:Serpin peptidase inhibitor, clade E (nexin, plasminogen activator inhibitor type 1), member 2 n=1 Tax=Labrus bergylta TaxID=56723 RepID=A0A3Q3MRI2_9LABR|nr:glia-derived nexin [Labrus bergylta]XP_020492479.1 glia-derived nexin [Labrus bergylta]